MNEKLLGKMNDTSTFLMTACEYCAYQESTKPCDKKPGKKALYQVSSSLFQNQKLQGFK